MKNKRFGYALILSLALHAVFAFVVYIEPSFLKSKSTPRTNTEVELIDAADLLKQLKEQRDANQGQIVSQSDKPLNDEIDEKSKYLSKHNQRVEKETQAALNDRFRNSTGSAGPQSPQQKAGEAQEQKEKTLSKNDEKVEDAKTSEQKDQKPSEQQVAGTAKAKEFLTDSESPIASEQLKGFVPSFRPKPLPMGAQASGGGEGPSATDDHLKKVPTGLQTLLSTREFVYYSYYNRIKDKLRQHWEGKIKEKMERVLRQGRTIASTEERVTKCVILLDAKGVLVRVQVVGASGLVDLDQAAVEAFQAAAPFPNPPKGIVEKDGFIRIRWDFILEANTTPLKFQNYAMN